MTKERDLPQAEQMRQIIKNIFELSTKLSFKFAINDLEDAANFAAKIYGFNSWKDYKSHLNKMNANVQLKVETSEYKKTVFNDILISQLKNYDIEAHSSLLKKSVILKDSKNLMLNEWLIGNHYKKQLKYKEPVGLIYKNSFITGGINSNIGFIFENQVKWLTQHNQNYIVFGCEDNHPIFQNIKHEITTKNIKIIGKDYIKLNPFLDLIKSDLAVQYFQVKSKNNNFPFLWLEIIKKLNNEHKKIVTIQQAINFTKLTTLLEFYKLYKNSNHSVTKMLANYLFKHCNIQIQEDTEQYLISSYSMEQHENNSQYLVHQLKDIDYLYQSDIFSENTQYSLQDLVFNKESIFIIKEKNKTYQDLMVYLYHDTFIKHEQSLKHINPDPYKYSTVFWEAEQWLNEYTAYNISKISDTNIKFNYVLSEFYHLEPLLNISQQILFLKQNLEGYSNYWKDKMLCETNNSEINFWYDKRKILRNLAHNEAVLWQINDWQCNIEGVEEYTLKLINFYNELLF